MSKDIIILAPNGRRVKIHCTADTSILQVLEDACAKQGFQPTDYDLKHHNHLLDLTSTVRFCNLPNKATLEMVEAEQKRKETNVVIGLLLEDGERKTADFSPNISLYDLIVSLAPEELSLLQNPTILYMRQEVIGLPALKEKSLRQLGLIAGRAVLRLLDKSDTMQANVSNVYRKVPAKPAEDTHNQSVTEEENKSFETVTPGPSGYQSTNRNLDIVDLVKKDTAVNKTAMSEEDNNKNNKESESITDSIHLTKEYIEESKLVPDDAKSYATQENLERRLKIEEEVTFVGTQKAVVFTPPDNNEEDFFDLPDDFYELTIEEVRKIYHELQKRRIELENIPLLTSQKREESDQQTSTQKINSYKNVVVRIQFPDNIILQGIFTPVNTIEDVTNFVKEHLQNKTKPFHIFTMPFRETLSPNTTLLEAKFVPCVHLHFKWAEDCPNEQYLKQEVYTKKTSSDAASILASKYRAPSRRKIEENTTNTQNSNTNRGSSTSKQSKVPKWFKK